MSKMQKEKINFKIIREFLVTRQCEFCRGLGKILMPKRTIGITPVGRGDKMEEKPCPVCNGSGLVSLPMREIERVDLNKKTGELPVM